MLTEITLKDYTTFINETTFDFKATNYKILENTNVGRNRILKGALFVGENASGKTQALKAIVLLLDLLFENSEPNYIIKKSLYTKGTSFSLTYKFNINNDDIKYDITFKDNSIIKEKLFVNEVLKLERINQGGNTYFEEENNIININPELSLLKLEYYNTRFNNDKTLNDWFTFLKNSLYINCHTKEVKTYNPSKIAEQKLTEYAEKNDISPINKLINNLGYNSEIVINKEFYNKDKEIFIKSEKDIIGLKKTGTNIIMPLPLESRGNQAFIGILLPIDFAVKNNCMIIVDEFSSGLHNELEEALIKYFFNNSKNSQLFFTSHSTNLLDTSILRPDQIYSFKFDSKKGTIIKRFSDENPRESQNIEKMYLNGVFDGMPRYNKEYRNK